MYIFQSPRMGLTFRTYFSMTIITLHNAFRARFSMLLADKFLKAMNTLIYNIPATREDYVQVTKSTLFPKPFVATGGLKTSQLLSELWQSGHLSSCMWTLSTKNSSQIPRQL
ncbi:hypothetical protein GOODEAATRI_016603 [Goodea atripinnis]|uniref:Uncharacterized protein n=1 Tax=Goodea atripinnis TaxID=208336 RepID=A0ABV0PPV3_9TELE